MSPFRSSLRERFSFQRISPEGWAWGFVLLCLVGAGIILINRPFNPDVSWGLTLGERILGGEKLYVDVIETNPPMTIFLYLPASLLARLTGFAPEILTVVLTAGFYLVCLCAALHALRDDCSRPRFIMLCTVCLWLLWLGSFAEREHFAVMALLPTFALWQVRFARRPVDALSIVFAGLGGGLATAIKPYFCLCLIFPALFTLVSQRDWRAILAPEYWIAALVSGLYVGAAFVLYPAYFHDVAPVLRETYLAYSLSLSELLLRPEWLICLSWLGILACIAPKPHVPPDWATASLLAGLGFFVAFLLQAKGFSNHVLPVVCLVFLGGMGRAAQPVWNALRNGRMAFVTRSLTLVGAAWLTVSLAWTAVQEDHPPPPRALAFLPIIRHEPPAKTLLAISPDLDVGHPLARSAGLHYAGSVSSLWLTGSALHRLEGGALDPRARGRMKAHIAADLNRLAADITTQRPDLVVLDSAHVSRGFLAREGPAAAHALEDYATIASSNGLELLERRGR